MTDTQFKERSILSFSRDHSNVREGGKEEVDDEEEEMVAELHSFPQPKSRKMRNKLGPLPDLRFQQSYLNSIAGAETVGNVIAITIRDQVMLPLIQGTVWSLALLGWAHWNRIAQVSGNSMGTKFKHWWYKARHWKVSESLRDVGGSAELAASVGDYCQSQNSCCD